MELVHIKCRNINSHSSLISCSVVSDSWRPHGLKPTRLLCPWNSPSKNAGWVAIPFSKGSSQPRDWTWVSCIAGRFFMVWAMRKPHSSLTHPHSSLFSVVICITSMYTEMLHKTMLLTVLLNIHRYLPFLIFFIHSWRIWFSTDTVFLQSKTLFSICYSFSLLMSYSLSFPVS